MRLLRKFLVVFIVSCLLFESTRFTLAFAYTINLPMAKTAAKEYPRVVKSTTLKVYKNASMVSEIVVTLAKGKHVAQCGKRRHGGWVKIRYAWDNPKYGYTKSKYLEQPFDIEAAEAKAMKKVKAAAKEYGWRFCNEIHDTRVRDYGFKWINSEYYFANEKYRLFVDANGEDFLSFHIQVYNYSDDEIKANEDAYSAKEAIPIFEKYRA